LFRPAAGRRRSRQDGGGDNDANDLADRLESYRLESCCNHGNRSAPVAGVRICIPGQRFHEAADLDPAELAGAIERDEIRCLYQPKVRLDDRRIVGLEVLTRWHSRAHGLVVPDLFIPLAERSGLIDRLTWHILARSLADFRPWRAQHPDLTLAVNLSPVSLTELGLPEQVSAVLADSATPPQSLVLEVTEGAVMADQAAAADILTRLRIRGVRISIDDFGTGYSSLLSLLRLPFNEIKIDQSFVRLLRHDPEAAKIIRAVVMLARELDVELVGEGIESDAEAARLAALGCPVGQGFLFAPPLSAAAMSARLAPATAAAA
jgi:EAL domain-containing protein (putative c-di-GMP-specific phosphodiesterase class I)